MLGSIRRKVRKLINARIHGICHLAVPAIGFASRFRQKDRPTRSLWAGRPILTLAVKAKAERLLGVEADTLVFQTYFITDAFDYDVEPWTRRPIARSFVYPFIFLWALWKYDRFHFFNDRGLMPQLSAREFNPKELAWYRQLGKEVYFWAYGADVRTMDATKAVGEPNCCTECPEPGRFCICDDAKGRLNQKRIAGHATARFSMGDMTPYTPGSRNDLYYWPLDVDAYEPRYPDPDGTDPLHVVHATNHRFFKGTRHVVDAVEKLKAEGVAIQLTIVEKLPNTEAVALYRQADIIFDQCMIGFHGYFALEGMAMGKPVVTFLRSRDMLVDPKSCPLLSARPEEIADVLRDLASDRRKLEALGRRGRAYVEKHHSVEAFAERLKAAFPPRARS